jgi:hypothetical protein
MNVYTILALDLANERTREALELRRADHLADDDARPSVVRRGLAAVLAVVSRSSGAAARRLDRVAADDFPRSLSATD